MTRVTDSDQLKKNFKDTLNLPRTNFPIRANAQEDDPRIASGWNHEKLSVKAYQKNKGSKSIILHDGPPYANGHIHLGHAYNKILKDIIAKYYRMSGYHVPVVPGWDCHGLPIEFQVSKEYPAADPIRLKQACRAYAQKWIDVQKEEFIKLGVLMDWNNPYLTMNPSYESSILYAFSQLIEAGYIERKNKTVPWCIFCKTVLAAAEIEYEDRKDISLFVKFQLDQTSVREQFPQLGDRRVDFIVWTTTPWTLPFNRAILLKPETEYVVLEIDDRYYIVARALAHKVLSYVKKEEKIIAEFVSDHLVQKNPRAWHPFIANFSVPVITDSLVTLDDGTACVHCAPGCGPQDYEVGIKHNLEIFSPLNPDGTYTAEVCPLQLVGMSLLDAHRWIIKMLQDEGNLFYKTSIQHPYPHCWRCHNGLIFRATKQWFCDLEKNNLKERVLQIIETVKNVPAKSKNRLLATIQGRLEWCLSRQRIWGAPIPALLCKQCDTSYINKDFVEKVAAQIAQQGIEYWDRVDIAELIPHGLACVSCGGQEFFKEKDILDVWFDSGVSHYAVLEKNPDLHVPADFYIEGKDQHRGWFQSSLLTSVILHNSAPMKAILTHGFVVDEKGRKMSKSIGNVVSPSDMVTALGTDGLRLWVSSVDYAGDAVVSDILMNNVKEVFRKIRNTCRFLLSNLYDFDVQVDARPLETLYAIDQYALTQLYTRYLQMLDAYQSFNFTGLFHIFADYCASDLSAFYLDIVKDRLYVETSDGHARRSAQTVLWYLLDTLTRMMAPVLSFTAEQLSDEYQKDKKESIHLQSLPDLESIWTWILHRGSAMALINNEEKQIVLDTQERMWIQLKAVRIALLKEIEKLREQGIIKHSLEAHITLYLNTTLPHLAQLPTLFKYITGQSREQFFKELLIVSRVDISDQENGLTESELAGVYVSVQPYNTMAHKCPRCWQWEESNNIDGLCNRCLKIVVRD